MLEIFSLTFLGLFFILFILWLLSRFAPDDNGARRPSENPPGKQRR